MTGQGSRLAREQWFGEVEEEEQEDKKLVFFVREHSSEADQGKSADGNGAFDKMHNAMVDDAGKKIPLEVKVAPWHKLFTLLSLLTLLTPECDKVWSRLSSHLLPFFWLIARLLKISDKKYRILTRRDKRDSYLNVLQQNNVQVC